MFLVRRSRRSWRLRAYVFVFIICLFLFGLALIVLWRASSWAWHRPLYCYTRLRVALRVRQRAECT